MLHGRRYTHLSRNLLFPLALLTLLCLPSLALATSDAGANDHGGPVVLVLFEIVIILAAAKLGGDLMVRLRQPEVLGELLIGIVLGNLSLIGIQSFEILRHDQILLVLSELGVILLLFEVGLHTTVADMMKVGTSALLVAVLGVVDDREAATGTGHVHPGLPRLLAAGRRPHEVPVRRLEGRRRRVDGGRVAELQQLQLLVPVERDAHVEVGSVGAQHVVLA